MRRLGERLARGDPIARVHAATETEADAAEAAVRGAYTLRDDAFEAGPLVRGRIA